MTRSKTMFLLGAGWITVTVSPALAESVVQQCGQQYQTAKAAGTLNGMTWGEYRTDCTARLKAQPASISTAPAAEPTVGAAAVVAPSSATEAATAPKAPISAGRAAMVARERQCGAEWRSTKVTLVAQTPGLKWPQYWSQCNTRLKAAGK